MSSLIKFDDRLAMLEPADGSGAISAYRYYLGELRAELAPMGGPELHAAVRDAGVVGMLREISEVPHAWGGTSQVHAGYYADNSLVAVKVCHPGAWVNYPRELFDLLAKAPDMGRHLPGVPVRAVLESLLAAAGNDFNFSAQAARQNTFHYALTGRAQPVAGLHVPAVRLVSSTILVTAWAHGRPLGDLYQDFTPERSALVASALAASVAASVAHTGMLHADPHPGNVLVRPDGGLTLVDFAQCANVPVRLGDVAAALLGATRDGDEVAALAALRSLALIPAKANVKASDALRAVTPLLAALDRPDMGLDADALTSLAAAAGKLGAWGGSPAVTEVLYASFMWLRLISRFARRVDAAAALAAHLPGGWDQPR